MSSAGEALKQALEVIAAQKAWIYAVPLDTPLPTMPGFDREWADGVELALNDAITAKEVQGVESSPTAGMNMVQRILHVGGRNNTAGYVEFGSIQAVEALVRHVLRDTTTPPAGDRSQKCWCETCRPITLDDMRMVLCPTCGNKRCPHATDHRHACTNSNEPGQTGSSYCVTFDKSVLSLGIPACGGPLCNEHNHHPLCSKAMAPVCERPVNCGTGQQKLMSITGTGEPGSRGRMRAPTASGLTLEGDRTALIERLRRLVGAAQLRGPNFTPALTCGDVDGIADMLAADAPADCTRSHPHENMSSMCELRTEIARLNFEAAQQVVVPDLRKLLEGMTVSIDVSTGDHDSGNRLFGVVNEVMEAEGDKNGMTLLVFETTPNFKQQVAVPQGWVEALARELCLWDQEDPDAVLDCRPDGDKLTWHRQDVKAKKLILAMLTSAPQPPQADALAADHVYGVLHMAPMTDQELDDLLPTNDSMSRADSLRWMARATERHHRIGAEP